MRRSPLYIAQTPDRRLSEDCLKIDRYFIKDMLVDKKSKSLIGSMIELCCNLEYEVIAEGVETVEQCNALQQFGCDTAQGFLFSGPVSPDEMSKLLRNGII